MEETHKKSAIVCAEQVEIFVPKSEGYLSQLRKLLDEMIFSDKIPFVDQDQKHWLRKAAEDRRPNLHRNFSFAEAEYWENLIFGYSIYDSDGYFVGPDSNLRRSRANYFEEKTSVIKLIVTNFVTPGVVYPVMHTAENCFMHTPQWMVSQSISPYRSGKFRSGSDLRFEYAITMLHIWAIVYYFFDQLTKRVMLDEQEIWVQRWHTQLSRRVKAQERGIPVAINHEEKRKKFGDKDYGKVICVIDYLDLEG